MQGFELAHGTDSTLGSDGEKIPEPAHPELDVKKMWEESKGLSAYTEKFAGMNFTVADLIRLQNSANSMFTSIQAGKSTSSVLIAESGNYPDDVPEKEKARMLAAFVSSNINLRITRILKGGIE